MKSYFFPNLNSEWESYKLKGRNRIRKMDTEGGVIFTVSESESDLELGMFRIRSWSRESKSCFCSSFGAGIGVGVE